MPNWCSTAVKFYSKDKEQVKMLGKKFTEIVENGSTTKTDFGNAWMGNFALAYFPEVPIDTVECRGWVDCVEVEEVDDYTVFTILTKTAWGPKIGLWNEIVKKFYQNVKISYIAEECGCDLFCKWDEDGLFWRNADFYADLCYPDKDGNICYLDDHNEFRSIEDIHDWFGKNLPFNVDHKKDLNELTELVQKLLDAYADTHDCEDTLYCVIDAYSEVSPDAYNMVY